MEWWKKEKTRCLLASSSYLESGYGSCKIHWSCWNLGWPFETELLVFTAELLSWLLQSYSHCSIIGNTQARRHSQKGIKCQKNLGENRFILLYFLMRMFSFMMAETFPLLELFPLMLLMKMRCSALNRRTLASWRQTSACAICKAANTRESLEWSFGVCAGQSFQTACLEQQGLSLALLMQPLRRPSTRWSHWLPWDLEMLGVAQVRGQSDTPDSIGQWTRSHLCGENKPHTPFSFLCLY